MDDFPAADAVWRYLAGQGCERRRTEQRPPDGRKVHIVQIWRHGVLLATGEHADPRLASSRALLDAVQLLAPPERPRLPARPAYPLVGA
ncbi:MULTISPECIES: hypothetical protein [Deinococcus]|uniref:Uncharacterized protein n=1 Tax=Deinococcus rufus TaxID=2136097 RepID=A0ABV7Z990_9DEIO|nr:hypothetical protein [Deinococcus sp. AB2017081]WQE95356.1 hypothetical protein U2P90_00325 [Deinococcus sp. AB2017081]